MSYHWRTREFLVSDTIGLAPRELEALKAAPIHRLVENDAGFGVIGDIGVGKTWALARYVADLVEQAVRDAEDPEWMRLPAFGFAVWVNWPERAESLKRSFFYRDKREMEDWIERAKTAARLFLDDLGRERSKGEDDYSFAVLSEIIDHRYRYRLPVFWTSNLTKPEEFSAAYSARFVSRLLGTWPPVLLQGQDLRLKMGVV